MAEVDCNYWRGSYLNGWNANIPYNANIFYLTGTCRFCAVRATNLRIGHLLPCSAVDRGGRLIGSRGVHDLGAGDKGIDQRRRNMIKDRPYKP